MTLMSSYILSCNAPASHRTPLPPRPRQDRAVVISLIFPETVSLPAGGFGARQPLPRCHPREEGLTPAWLRWSTGKLSGRRHCRHPTEAEGGAGIRRPQQLPTSRPPEVPVPFWRCHEAAGSAGQWEADPGRRRVWLRGVRSLQNLPPHRQHPPRCFCQGFCLQVSGESACCRHRVALITVRLAHW